MTASQQTLQTLSSSRPEGIDLPPRALVWYQLCELKADYVGEGIVIFVVVEAAKMLGEALSQTRFHVLVHSY